MLYSVGKGIRLYLYIPQVGLKMSSRVGSSSINDRNNVTLVLLIMNDVGFTCYEDVMK